MNNFVRTTPELYENKCATLFMPNTISSLYIETLKSRFNKNLPIRYAITAIKSDDHGWRKRQIIAFFDDKDAAEKYLDALVIELNKGE